VVSAVLAGHVWRARTSRRWAFARYVAVRIVLTTDAAAGSPLV
jgi:hypothetical protein